VVRVFTVGEAKRLSLPGRISREVVSGATGAEHVTVRHVEIDAPKPGEPKRGPHVHHGFEECIFVLSGEGVMESEDGEHPVKAGSGIIVPAGELHVTHNIGDGRLVLLCFFPVGDVASATREFRSWAEAKAAS
jgi:mannose-6-phosphate isomerase-like protein (cupin superfamily)